MHFFPTASHTIVQYCRLTGSNGTLLDGIRSNHEGEIQRLYAALMKQGIRNIISKVKNWDYSKLDTVSSFIQGMKAQMCEKHGKSWPEL